MNDDLISRQAAIDLVRGVCNAIMSGCESWYDPEIEDEVYKDIREVDAILKCNKEVRIALQNMPSVTPKQRTGEWIWSGSAHRCSKCNEYTCFAESKPPKYCPNCGARMRGEE